jgi:hypothetical protein
MSSRVSGNLFGGKRGEIANLELRIANHKLTINPLLFCSRDGSSREAPTPPVSATEDDWEIANLELKGIEIANCESRIEKCRL